MLRAGVALLLLAGCDDDPARNDQLELVDTGVTADMAAVVPTPDAGPSVDQGPLPDAELPPILEAPQALVFLNDPITDNNMRTQVTLAPSTDPRGHLTSASVQVFNCLNEPGGLTAMPSLGGLQLTVALCHEVQTVVPDADGNYLSVAPPAEASDPNDAFAELMMYHHVNQVHDYYKGTHGFTDLDFPLPAIVNLQFKITPPLPIPGFMPGPDGWYPFPNAAYFPKESWNELASSLGLPGRDSDSIIFGQADFDFSYDARVIYHEYTHAVIGTERLQAAAAADRYGLDASPRAMNEGLADYFAASLSDGSAIGVFAIGELDPSQVRDLAQAHRCPDDLIDEVHADGRIIGSALWAVRTAIGAERTDAIVYRAIEQFTAGTSHQVAGELILAEAEAEGEEVYTQVLEILGDFGLVDCVRSTPWPAGFRADRTGLPHRVEGRSTVGLNGFGGGVPAYKQFSIDLPPTALAVTLSWELQGGGGLFGGGGAVTPLDLLIRQGETVEVVLGGRTAEFRADARFSPPLEGTRQTITLDRDCFPAGGGRIHTLFVNGGQDPVALVRLDRTILEAIDESPPNLVHCVEAPPAPDAGVDAAPADAALADAGVDAAP